MYYYYYYYYYYYASQSNRTPITIHAHPTPQHISHSLAAVQKITHSSPYLHTGCTTVIAEWCTPDSPQYPLLVTTGMIPFIPAMEGQGRKALVILRVPQMAGANFSTSFG
jgi:hypothetical protein